jgi:hypothetical protein
MKIGDLVVIKGEWAKHNAWMVDTFLDDGDKETYGIVIATRLGYYTHKVMWPDGSDDWYESEALEVKCK